MEAVKKNRCKTKTPRKITQEVMQESCESAQGVMQESCKNEQESCENVKLPTKCLCKSAQESRKDEQESCENVKLSTKCLCKSAQGVMQESCESYAITKEDMRVIRKLTHLLGKFDKKMAALENSSFSSGILSLFG